MQEKRGYVMAPDAPTLSSQERAMYGKAFPVSERGTSSGVTSFTGIAGR